MEGNTKSKNLHKPPFVLSIFRFIFKHIGAMFPSLIGRWAYRLWFKTYRTARPRREESWLRSATKIEAVDIHLDATNKALNIFNKASEINPLPVMTYYWKNKNETKTEAPLVMLVHGWTGRGSQMAAFAEPLLKAGFRVLAFDNHAHDLTPGKATSLFIQSEVQQQLTEKFGPVYAVVTHSFGGMVTPYSLSHGMKTQKVVCISPPARFDYVLQRFSNTLFLPETIQQYMVRRFKKEFGDDLVERVSATTTCKQLGHIPVLIIHDENDIDVPASESEQLHQAWPNSKLKYTKGLGHRAILYDAEVIRMTVDFIK